MSQIPRAVKISNVGGEPYDPGPGTPLARSALPVLQSLLGEGLEGQPASVILTDARGVVLCRLTADHDLERHLDSIQLAPGFSYAEEFAGTNGSARRWRGGQAAHVSGHEHYAGQLVDLACAAVPIRHPVSGLRINEGEAHAQDIDLRSR